MFNLNIYFPSESGMITWDLVPRGISVACKFRIYKLETNISSSVSNGCQWMTKTEWYVTNCIS